MADVIYNIQRFDSDKDAAPYFKEYKVLYTEGMTVLDGLYYILEHLDGTLAFRSSCRSGVCGSCGMNINGEYCLACETQVAYFGSYLTVKPLGNMKIVKDLVVDLEPFWNKFKSIRPYLMPGNPDPDPEKIERIQTEDDRALLEGLIDCILCGCCQAACPMTGTDEEYLGPAILMKADRFARDSRDGAIKQRLDTVDSEHGVWRCHTVYDCQVACPKSLDPTGAIADLKRKAVAQGTGCSFLGKI